MQCPRCNQKLKHYIDAVALDANGNVDFLRSRENKFLLFCPDCGTTLEDPRIIFEED